MARILKQGMLMVLLSRPRKFWERERKVNGVSSFADTLEERGKLVNKPKYCNYYF